MDKYIITVLYGTVAFALTAPIFAISILRIRTRTRMLPFFTGLLVYISFGMLAKNLINMLFTSVLPFGDILGTNKVAYTIYTPVVGTAVEIFAMYLAFKKVMPDTDDRNNAMAFGVGYGGMSCLYYTFLTSFMNLVTYVSYDAVGEVEFRTKYIEAALMSAEKAGQDISSADVKNSVTEEIDKLVEYLKELSFFDVICDWLMRIVCAVILVEIVMILFYGIRKNVKIFIKFAAAAYAVTLIPQALCECGILPQIATVCICGAFAIVLWIGAVKLYRLYDSATVVADVKELYKMPMPLPKKSKLPGKKTVVRTSTSEAANKETKDL